MEDWIAFPIWSFRWLSLVVGGGVHGWAARHRGFSLVLSIFLPFPLLRLSRFAIVCFYLYFVLSSFEPVHELIAAGQWCCLCL